MSNMLSALLRKSLADVTRRKGRTFTVVLGIMIGVCLFTATSVSSSTLSAAFSTTLNRARVPDITCAVQALDPSLIPLISALPNVQSVQVQTNYTTNWHLANNQGVVPLDITGYPDPGHTTFYAFQLTGGHYPGPSEIVLDITASHMQSFALGDFITVTTPTGRSVQLRVAGEASTRGLSFSANPRGYMRSDALSLVTGTSDPNIVAIKVRDETQAPQTDSALISLLLAHHVQNINASINAYAQQSTGSAVIVPQLFLLAAVLLAALLVINTIITLLIEQTRIIGIMKALGGTRATIFRSYLVTVAIYACLGTIVGVGLGILVAYITTIALARRLTAAPGVPLTMGPLVVTPATLAICLLLGFALPVATALLPLWRGTRISVREALSTYGISGARRTAASPYQMRWTRKISMTWMPQIVWLGLRNLFRRRGRAALTLLALALYSAAFLAEIGPLDTLGQRLSDAYASYHYDFQLFTHQQQPFSQFKAQLLAQQPNIEDVERGNGIGVNTRWGQIALQEIEANSQMYSPQLVAGRWFQPGERNFLVLNDTAAALTGLSAGDTMALTDVTRFGGHGYSATWRIIGIVHDDSDLATGFGLAITTPQNYNRFFHLPIDSEQGILFVKLHDPSPQAIQELTNWVNRTFNRIHFTTAAYSARSYHQQIQQQGNASLKFVHALLLGSSALVALVGILVMTITLISSIIDRGREIGIVRALGARGWQVACIFWIEGVALGFLSWAAGYLLSIPLSRSVLNQFSTLVPIPLLLNPYALLETFLALLVVITLASVIPIRLANRLQVADALHYE